MEILKVEHVKKSFNQQCIIEDLSFTVNENSVFGLIGKNGVGKTTTMKMILGFLKPTAGEITVCGERVVYGGAKTNKYIGYLPDVPEFYGYMRPKEYLKFCGEISGLKPDKTKQKTEELLALVGLEGVNKKISSFSRGMKQRLGIAQALLGEPKLLICDEPTSALDPIGRKEILDILSVARQQTSILFSTHILSDVERICDEIGILDKGKIVLQGNLNNVKDSYRQDSVQIELSGKNIERIIQSIKKLPFVTSLTADENTITVHLANAKTQGKEILDLLLKEEASVMRYEVLEPSLEDLFLEVVQ